jgi:lysophospholipase L1-like esterase
MLASVSFVFQGCRKDEEPLLIVYLGDSIAEGIAGPSPLSKREDYGYYAMIGRCNEFEYRNRSVSGHQSAQLLEIINREDDGARITHTLIKDADIIHISILGNDVLQTNFGPKLIAAAQTPADFTEFDAIMDQSRINFANIVETIRTLNPDVTLIIETLYNPADNDSLLVNEESRATLTTMGYTPDDYRGLADSLIQRLNAVILDYHVAHPDAYYVADVYTAFKNIYDADRERGCDLIFPDWIHPSNEGHAIIFEVNQALLTELGFANDAETVLNNYKSIRAGQIETMFSGSLDVAAVKTQINGATTLGEVTEVYFNAIAGKTPVYC